MTPTTWLGLRELSPVEWTIGQTATIFKPYICPGSEESLFRRLKTANGESRIEGWSSKALIDGSVTVLLAGDERKGGNTSGKEPLRTYGGV